MNSIIKLEHVLNLEEYIISQNTFDFFFRMVF